MDGSAQPWLPPDSSGSTSSFEKPALTTRLGRLPSESTRALALWAIHLAVRLSHVPRCSLEPRACPNYEFRESDFTLCWLKVNRKCAVGPEDSNLTLAPSALVPSMLRYVALTTKVSCGFTFSPKEMLGGREMVGKKELQQNSPQTCSHPVLPPCILPAHSWPGAPWSLSV